MNKVEVYNPYPENSKRNVQLLRSVVLLSRRKSLFAFNKTVGLRLITGELNRDGQRKLAFLLLSKTSIPFVIIYSDKRKVKFCYCLDLSLSSLPRHGDDAKEDCYFAPKLNLVQNEPSKRGASSGKC